jgi:hypothetical protein
MYKNIFLYPEHYRIRKNNLKRLEPKYAHPIYSNLSEVMSVYKLINPTCIICVFFFSGWGETESTWYVGQCWPIVPAPDDR